MTLAELADYVTQKVGQTDTQSVAICKTFLDRRYRMIWDSANWRDTLVLFSVNTTVNSPWILMPYGIERVQKVRVGNDNTLSPFDAGTVFDFSPTLFENFGTAAGFMTFAPVVMGPYAGTSPFQILLAGIPSTDGGLSGTLEYEDATGNTLVLNDIPLGADVSTGVNPTFVLRFNKPASNADYTLFIEADGSLTMPAASKSAPRKARIKLLQGPSTATACLVLGKRSCPGFNGGTSFFGQPGDPDNETPTLLNVDNALIAFAQSDMLERQRQYSKAASKAQEGAAQVKIMLDLELNQSAEVMRIIPAPTNTDFYYYDSFGARGKNYW